MKKLGRASDHVCARCEQRRAESWHHRLPVARGGPDDKFNCRPLCGSGTTGCHGWVHANPADAEAEGLYVRGRVLRGVYEGPDSEYRRRYGGGEP